MKLLIRLLDALVPAVLAAAAIVGAVAVTVMLCAGIASAQALGPSAAPAHPGSGATQPQAQAGPSDQQLLAAQVQRAEADGHYWQMALQRVVADRNAAAAQEANKDRWWAAYDAEVAKRDAWWRAYLDGLAAQEAKKVQTGKTGALAPGGAAAGVR